MHFLFTHTCTITLYITDTVLHFGQQEEEEEEERKKERKKKKSKKKMTSEPRSRVTVEVSVLGSPSLNFCLCGCKATLD